MKDKLAGSIDLFAETEKLYQCISNRFAQIFVSGIRILYLRATAHAADPLVGVQLPSE